MVHSMWACGDTDCERHGPIALGRSAMPSLWSAFALFVAFVTHVGAFKLDPVFGRLNSVVDLTGASLALMMVLGIIVVVIRPRLPRPVITDLLVLTVWLFMLVGCREVVDAYSRVKVATFAVVTLPLYFAARMLPTHVSETCLPRYLTAIGLYVQLTGMMFGTWSSDWGGVRLIQGAGANYLSLGYVAGSTSVMLWIGQYESRASVGRVFLRMMFALSIVVVLLSAARGPLVAVTLCMLLYGFLGRKLSRYTVISGFFFTVLIAVVARSSIITPIAGRFASLAAESGALGMGTRGPLFAAAIRAIGSTPTGVGTGNFASLMGTVGRDYPHNILLEVGAENGWIALAAISLLLARNAHQAVSMIRDEHGTRIALLFCFALVSAMFSGDINDHRLLWVTVGAMQRIIGKEAK